MKKNPDGRGMSEKPDPVINVTEKIHVPRGRKQLVSPDPAEPLWDIDDLAAHLKVKRQTIYWWRTDHPEMCPPAIRLGRQQLRWRPSEVRAFLDSRRERAS